MRKRDASGAVYLIGAGPGDSGLMTLKGRERLEQSDVVFFDALVNPEILSWARPDAVRIDVGKRGHKSGRGKRSAQQSSINALLAGYARKGLKVARLKGGDPFLFGRGGEEAEYLAERKIPFEVVPGVSSVTAVPAYAGIPVTDRRCNSMLTVVTGRSGEEKGAGPGIDWRRISPSGTLVVLMGVGSMKAIFSELRKNGWPARTPAACIQRGTMPEQRTVAGTLGNLLAKVRRMRPPLSSPAVIVVGRVAAMRSRIRWFDPQ